MFTGSLPVHDAPPINFLVSGLLGASSEALAALESALFPDDLSLACVGTALEASGLSFAFENTMKLSSAVELEGTGVFFGFPPPPRLACPFRGIFSNRTVDGDMLACGIHGYQSLAIAVTNLGNKLGELKVRSTDVPLMLKLRRAA